MYQGVHFELGACELYISKHHYGEQKGGVVYMSERRGKRESKEYRKVGSKIHSVYP